MLGLLTLGGNIQAEGPGAEPPEEGSAREEAQAPVSTAKALANLSLEDLASLEVGTVYGASKHEQSTLEAPASVTIVTGDDIKRFGYRTLADVLQSVRGFYITSDRVYTYIGVRGVNRPGDFGGRILITINGHRINDPIFDQAFNGTEFPLDVDLIERVEVIRGPGSSLYGNNAFFAVINVVTRNGRELKGAEVSGAYASYNTYSGRVSYGNRFTNGVEVLFSGTWFQSDGHDRLYFPEFKAINGGVAEHLDGSRAPSAWGSVSYGDFSIEGGYVARRKDIPDAPYGLLFNTGPAWQEDDRGFVGLKLEHRFEEDWTVCARLYYDYYRSPMLGPYDSASLGLPPGQTVLEKYFGYADWLNGEAQVSKRFLEKHLVTVGADFHYDLDVEQEDYVLDPHQVLDDVRTHDDSFGLYAQEEYSIRTNVILNVGGRFDYFEQFGSTENPRAALIYSPFSATTLKAIYGQAFRAPNASEFDYYSVAGSQFANPNLKPEQIRSYELLWEQGLWGHWRWTTDLFYEDMNDLITQVYDNTLQGYIFRNTDDVDTRGVELELEGRWKSGLRGYVNYTYADAYQESGGSGREPLENSPKHMAKLGISAPLWRQNVFASLETQVLSRRRTENGSVPGYETVNFTLFSHELVRGLEASLSLYNLLDERYRDPVSPNFTQTSIEEDGRTFRFKLTYRF
jgi:iron complex outermembrane receptor protein